MACSSGSRKLLEDLEAALLRLDQMRQPLLHRRIELRRREGRGAGGTLLPGQLLALHEVEQRHQRARHARVGGGVGGLEHHRQHRRDAF